MPKLSVEYWPLDRLKEYSRNPRINDRGIEAVARSIKEYGFLVPIVASDDGTIIAGHTRFAAARRLGMGEVPVVRASHLSERQARAFRIADNKVAELSDWDYDLLGAELREILGDAPDIDVVLGFTDSEILSMLNAEADPYSTRIGRGKITRRKAPDVRQGEVWQLGEHMLYCGCLPEDISAACCIAEWNAWNQSLVPLCSESCAYFIFQPGGTVAFPEGLDVIQMAVGVRSLDADGEPMRIKHDSVLLCARRNVRLPASELPTVWEEMGQPRARRRGALLKCLSIAGVGPGDTVLMSGVGSGEIFAAATECQAQCIGIESAPSLCKQSISLWMSGGEDRKPALVRPG